MQRDSILKIIYRFFDLIVLTYIVFDFGYSIHIEYQTPKFIGLVLITIALFAFNIFKYFYYKTSGRKKVALVNSFIIGVLLLVALIVSILNFNLHYLEVLRKIRPILEAGLIFYFIIRLMILVRYVYEVYYNPAIVFVGSFFAIIIIGSFLLMLPNATTNGISFTDALFTSTSAVCVTGLIVLDTATDFTTVGQTIIISLIQIGGLGILTFTSFFAFFFRGSSSFKEGLNVRDFIAQDTLKDVLKMALNVVVFTLSVELIGALFIYSSILDNPAIEDKIFFSIFHAISAFCNAGFSTLSAGLSESYLQFNYYLQWIVIVMVVFGGLGYNIIFNFYQYIKIYVVEFFDRKRIHKQVSIMTLNSKIVLYTTGALLVGGFVFLWMSEYHNTMNYHQSLFGKITSTAFNAVTPRTAGFNTIDFTEFTVPTLLFIIFLMWIGASPASTGGGIKTSTFALATLNIFAIARGKSRIQLFGRRISSESTSRAFAILCISLIVIGFAILALLIFEPKGTDLLSVVFECFSAYSTVGLSLNFTPTLTEPSKYVLIATMFIGRIGMLNLMIGLLRQINHQFYEYPKENILIN
ncbi:TrkH family potassium uptake protein [Flavobacterium lacus]|uniref:Trk-type K+ transport system membrane component n=1 Tax=Flavobacterium lacus TaxID=1353778 RepID=A0A328X2F3_9FLAO|nr:potassium transporter TrkG [Flavobacterium lacus]RAR49588.1 Trk-type K+ transport system membrane component [Flavobacterium lacus]